MYEFLGLVRISFTNKETGEVINGWQLWVGEPAESPSVGMRPVKKWISDENFGHLFGPLGGAPGVKDFVGHPILVNLGLRGQIMSVDFE